MKIILNQNIESLGNEGDILSVKDGYARNYLIPKGWAKHATNSNIESIQNEIQEKQKKEAKTRENLEALGKQLDKLSLKLELKAGEEGRLFGSVTSHDIERGLAEQGHEVSRRVIELAEPIKELGTVDVTVHVHKDVSVTLKVEVVAE